jgi:hypothetical protein
MGTCIKPMWNILNYNFYYQKLHFKYVSNLTSHWLQASWGWYDSVETCRSVIICEIIVHLLVLVQNNFANWIYKRRGKRLTGRTHRERITTYDILLPCQPQPLLLCHVSNVGTYWLHIANYMENLIGCHLTQNFLTFCGTTKLVTLFFIHGTVHREM